MDPVLKGESVMLKQIIAVTVGTVAAYAIVQGVTLVALGPITRFTMKRTMEVLS